MSQMIDVSGLPQPIVEEIQRLVATLQANLASSARPPGQPDAAALDDFELLLDAVCEGLPPLPLLPTNFSRADIYGEND